MVYISIIIYVIYLTLCNCMPNNVCKTLEDYRTVQNNPNCWYNPDIEAQPNELAQKYGFPFETYEVQTKDGYINTLFRIPHNGSNVSDRRPVIFLQHGLAVDGSSWFSLGQRSNVFFLANKGYDVWISNCRGNFYSSKHVQLTQFDPQYWIFSFHEMGIYDLPSMLDFVASKTGQPGEITYIGHSMGTTISYVYASLLPQEANKNLKRIISLAPVAFMDHVSPLIKSLAAQRNLIWDFLTSLGFYGVGHNFEFKLSFIRRLCSRYPFIVICANFVRFLYGNRKEVDAVAFPTVVRKLLSGLSLKTLFHYAQIIGARRRFQLFDYGPGPNRKLYNSSFAPEYPLANIKVPVDLIYSPTDGLATKKDVLHLFNKLETRKTIKEVADFEHTDFVDGPHANDFYETILSTYL